MSVLRLNVLGGLRMLTRSGEPLVLSAKKPAALLSFVAMHAGQDVSRDKLAAMLWQDSGETQARSSLRQSLVVLRKTLPEGVLTADTSHVRIDRGAIEVDALELERLLEARSREALEGAMGLYRGDLLDGFNPRAPAFDAWVMPERQRLRERALQAMETLLEGYRESGDTQGGIRAATRLLSLDPVRERIHRRLMDLYASTGRRDAALQQYRLCRETLQRELGVNTEPETDRLAERIRRARHLPSTPGHEAEREAAAGPLASGAAPPAPEPPLTRASAEQPVNELRQVAVLVIGRGGDIEELASVGPERLHSLLSRYVACIERSARRHGGTVCRQFGELVMVVFGIPRAHDYDAELAVRAAWSIHRELEALGEELGVALRAQMGVACGRVVTDTASAAGPERAIVGEPVSRAAALAARAPEGETLISATVHRSVSDRIEREPWTEHEPDGAPPSAWRTRAGREPEATPSVRRPFVGRRTELRQLVGALEACLEDGRGHTFLVRGEAGIGKSRFVEEVAAEAEQRGFASHRVLVLELGAGLEHDPVRALTRSLIDARDEAAGMEEAAERFAERAGLGDHERIHLRGLLELPPPPGLEKLLDAMDASARARGRRTLLDRIVREASARQPLLLVIDDLHWAEPSTLELVGSLSATVPECPTVLVGTSRVEGAPLDEPAWRDAVRDHPLSTIDLYPLHDREARELAAQLSDIEAQDVHACLERAEGNPLFLEQLLRNRAEGETVPGTVHSLVLAQLDRLAPIDRRAAQAASILGRRVSLRALRHVMDEASYVPDALVHEHLLRPMETESGSAWIFSHDLLADAVGASVLAEDRRRLHARAAEWYAERDLVLHAEHLDRSGARDAAADAYLEAARRRADERRPEPALRLAGRGLLAADAPGTRYVLEMVRADALRQLGRAGGVIEACERARDLAGDDAQRARAWLGIAGALRLLDRYDEAFDALSYAERAARRCGGTVELSRVGYERGSAHFPRGDLEACLGEHREALDLARRAGSAWDEARALSGLGDAYYQRGALRTAHEHFEQCIGIAKRRGFGGIEVANLPMRANIGIFLCRRGALSEAYEAIRRAEAAGDPRNELLARTVTPCVLDWRGEWEQLERDARIAWELAERLGSARFAATTAHYLAVALAAQDRYDEARPILEHAYARSCEVGHAFCGPAVLAAIALTSDPAGRRAALDEGQALLDRGCVSHNYLRFYPHGMYAAWADGDADRVARYADALEAYVADEPVPWSELFVAWGRALAGALRGEANDHDLRSVRQRATESEMRLAAAVVDVQLGEATKAPFTSGCGR